MLVSLSAWGLGWGQQQWGRAFNPPPYISVLSDAGCRDVETLLSLTELLGSLRYLKSTLRGAEGFGLVAEKYEN